jgi:hypothetical protein
MKTGVSDMHTASIIRTMIALIMEAVRTSETSVYFHEIIQRHIPEGCRSQKEVNIGY